MENSRRLLAIDSCRASHIQQWLHNISHNINGLFRQDSVRAKALTRQLKLVKPNKTTDAYEKMATDNVDRLARLLALNNDSTEILNFLLCANADETLLALAGEIEVRTHRQFCEKLGLVIGIPTKRIYASLVPAAPLLTYGLIDRSIGGNHLANYLNLNHELESVLNAEIDSDVELMRPYFTVTSKPTLTLDDFSHLAPQVNLAMRYLKSASASGTVGVNLLFFGLPGTGKSELARLLGQELGLATFQVNAARDDGMAANDIERLASYVMAQKYCAASLQTLLIFDEIEDVFNEQVATRFGTVGRQVASCGKNWLNQQLENNPVPTIWIANRVDTIDAAHLRRFDYSIQFTTLPLAVRTNIVRRHFHDAPLSDMVEAQLAARKALVPAQVAMAAKVAHALPDELIDSIALYVINASMTLLSQEIPAPTIPLPEFDFSLANADVDLQMLLYGIARGDGNGQICLAGPSGVGKSAYARFMAQTLKRPCRAISASDILSPYVGENEMNIARVFARAEANREVLIFDEADGLLSKRDDARARWETSLVNEFLAQIDAFHGLAIFTTNRHTMLDHAVFRRVDVKVFFKWLRLDQRVTLLQKVSQQNTIDDELLLARLKRLNCLSTGDFMVAKRRQKMLAEAWSLPDWLNALEADCRFKIIDQDNLPALS